MSNSRRERLSLGRRLIRASGRLLLALSLLAAGAAGATYAGGRYHLEIGQSALILQAGQLAATVRSPGWHLHLPWPFQSHVLIGSPGGERLVVGADPGDPPSSPESATAPADPDPAAAGAAEAELPFFALTRDSRSFRLRYIVNFEIDDPVTYHFEIRDPEAILRGGSAVALRGALGARHSGEFAAVGRGQVGAPHPAAIAELERDALARLRSLVEGTRLGLRVRSLRLIALAPPPPAEAAAAQLETAERAGREALAEARAYRNRIVSRARNRAVQLTEAALGERDEAIALATGEAARFEAVAEEYLRAPDVVQTRLWLETLEVVLPAAMAVFVAEPGTVLPSLPPASLLPAPEAESQGP